MVTVGKRERNARAAAGALADVRRALRPAGRAQIDSFAIEGFRLHERALRGGQRVERAVAAESLRTDASERVRSLLHALHSSGTELHFVSDAGLEELTGGRSLGAIVGLVPVPRARGLDEVLAAAPAPAVALVAVEVEDPGNVGALVRTALAAGACGFGAVGISDPYHPRAVRTSMGSLFKLPIARYASVGVLLDALGGSVRKLGAVSSGGVPPWDAGPEAGGAVALFVGGEAFGLSESVRQRMDALVTVPMDSGVDSFSVNAAAAVVLYELGRRRALSPGRRS